jgi:hypothetical protein
MTTMTTLNPAQIAALRQIAAAVVEAVREAGPMGAPGGHLYAALMAQGCTLSQFESLMGALVRTGKLTKRGQCYHVAGV